MFVRMSRYIELAGECATQRALAWERERAVAGQLREAAALRDEVRRLTDIIVALKREGQSVPAGHGDVAWERYVIDDVPRATAAEKEAAFDDAAIRREIEAELKMLEDAGA